MGRSEVAGCAARCLDHLLAPPPFDLIGTDLNAISIISNRPHGVFVPLSAFVYKTCDDAFPPLTDVR
jgi:hypothetical protein